MRSVKQERASVLKGAALRGSQPPTSAFFWEITILFDLIGTKQGSNVGCAVTILCVTIGCRACALRWTFCSACYVASWFWRSLIDFAFSSMSLALMTLTTYNLYRGAIMCYMCMYMHMYACIEFNTASTTKRSICANHKDR